MWSKVRRVARYSALAGVAGGSGATAFSLYQNDGDVSALGVVRLSRAALTVADIARTYKRVLYFKEWDDKTSVEYKQCKSAAHTEAAHKLLGLCCLNKGVYIKVGQHIGALEYLLPGEYVKTMKVLHSRAPQNPVEDLYKVIRKDLKQEPLELFATFDPEPLGTASLAQVHRATLKTGEEVAVKVQHPFVKKNSKIDLKTMEVLVNVMSWMFPDFKMQWLVEETKKNLPVELDFMNEGRNADKVREMFKEYAWLKIPRIHWELSTTRVLVMDYLRGGQVDDIEYIDKHKIDRIDIASKIGLLYSNMIFTHGFVHSDPHPGNILMKKASNGGTEVILLDHGLYATLTESFRYEYSKLWLSILSVDRVGMRQHCLNLGIKRDLYPLFACMLTGRPWESVVAGINKTPHSTNEKDVLQSSTSIVLPRVSEILEQVDRQMLLVLKTNDLIRSIETSLGTLDRMTSFLVMSKCCIRSVAAQDQLGAVTRLERVSAHLSRFWSIFRLNAMYFWLGLWNFSLLSTLRHIL